MVKQIIKYLIFILLGCIIIYVGFSLNDYILTAIGGCAVGVYGKNLYTMV
jgi:hypothetical protein